MNQSNSNFRLPVSNDLQERTLKVTNFSDQVTKDLLYELFLQCGPVRNVVFKPDFAFIEFEHKVSVAFALALMDGVYLFGKKLELQPKIADHDAFVYLNQLKQYEATVATQPFNWWNRFSQRNGEPIPPHLCSAVLNKITHDSPQILTPDVNLSPYVLNISSHSDPSPHIVVGGGSGSSYYETPRRGYYDPPRGNRSLSPSSHRNNYRYNEPREPRRDQRYPYDDRQEYHKERFDNNYNRGGGRDGGPDRDHGRWNQDRYNPYGRQDSRQYPEPPYQDERRNSFPVYRDHRIPPPKPSSRYHHR